MVYEKMTRKKVIGTNMKSLNRQKKLIEVLLRNVADDHTIEAIKTTLEIAFLDGKIAEREKITKSYRKHIK